MQEPRTILVVDRNPRIRDFVKRELLSDGHRVLTAENTEALRRCIARPERLDALVIDPNMPGLDGVGSLERLLLSRPALPVVFHCQICDRQGLVERPHQWVFVEKTGQSVDAVRRQVLRLLGLAVDAESRTTDT